MMRVPPRAAHTGRETTERGGAVPRAVARTCSATCSGPAVGLRARVLRQAHAVQVEVARVARTATQRDRLAALVEVDGDIVGEVYLPAEWLAVDHHRRGGLVAVGVRWRRPPGRPWRRRKRRW